MNQDLLNLIKLKYIQQSLSQNFIEKLPEKYINTIRKNKLYHFAKFSTYKSVGNENCSMSLNWAVIKGYIDICEWIVDNTCYTFDCFFGNHPQILAARSGNLEMMKWLYDTAEIEPNSMVKRVAKYGGHKDVLEWLDEIM